MSQPNDNKQLRPIIIGGGLAGLTAALHLAERGLQPLVLEADPDWFGGRIGGREGVRLTSADGREWIFPAEHGIHGLWWQYKNLKGIMTRHGFMPKLVLANRQDWVHGETSGKIRRAEMGRASRRTLWPAPFHYGTLFFRPSFLGMLTFKDVLRSPLVLGSLFTALGIDPLVEGLALEGKTLKDYCKGWPPRMTAFVASLARSGLSAHPEDIPMAGFIAFLRFFSLMRRDSQRFHFLPADPETTLIGPLVERVRGFGGEVRKGVRVTQLERWNEDGWRIWTENGQTFEAQNVILATDAPATNQILSNSPATREITESMRWPKGLTTVVVRFWFSEPPRRKKSEAGIISGNFILDNFFWLSRIQDVFIEWNKATGGSAVEAHIYSQENIALDDETLLAKARADICRLFPDLKDKIIHATLQRNKPSHTLFGVGSMGQHIGVRTPWPGLSCCGDWVRYPSPALFLERATSTGIAAANVILEKMSLQPFPLEKYDKPEILARVMSAWMRQVRDRN